MRFHIVSWNVNGLHMNGIHGPRKLLLRQELISHFPGGIDVLLAQEHKLSLDHSHRCGKLLPGVSHTFWVLAIGDMSRSGGVCISIGRQFISHIQHHGILIPGRALWVSLLIDGGSYGLLSIYAPTDARAWSLFWDSLAQSLPCMDSWIVGGDFNNVELPSDVSFEGTPRISSIAPCERENWDRFMLAILGEDV